ncbi:hypothetical protein YC2023_095046 [Brassica napus]
MSNEGGDGNNNNIEYMISPKTRKPPPILLPLPENDEVTIPMTPSEFKDRLIFGPSPRDSSQYFHSLSQKHSPSSSAAAADTLPDSSPLDPLLPPQHHYGHPLHRSKTAPAMAIIDDLHHPMHQQTELEPSSRSVVRQAFALLVVYLSLGVLIYVVNQTHPVVDAWVILLHRYNVHHRLRRHHTKQCRY